MTEEQNSKLEKIVLTTLDDMKAKDIVTLNVKHLTALMDVMVICCGRSKRHVKSIAEDLVKNSKEAGIQPLSITGLVTSEWVLVDLSGIVVHIMLPEIREFYQLEKLWTFDENDDN